LKFRIEDIPPEGRKEAYAESETWLEGRLGGEAERNFRFGGLIQIRVNLSRSGQVVLIHSRCEAPVELVCARCLERFPRTLTSEYSTSLKPEPDFSLVEQLELSREDLQTEFYEGEEIDITPLMQDQVLLSLPSKALCREDCRGLCPHCGTNLNRHLCQCREQLLDPRFAALKNFRVH
jgi:uncharacterized protein